jgi:hypothetical protein
VKENGAHYLISHASCHSCLGMQLISSDESGMSKVQSRIIGSLETKR